jgi:large subunit ribosomal protein L3
VPTALSVSAALAKKSYTLRQRTGVLATKKGMTAVYDVETGKRTPCTVLQLDRCQVVSHKTKEKHGYYAVQIGCGHRSPRNLTRAMLGHYAVSEVAPKKQLVEFRVRGAEGLPPVGEELKASWFKVGQYVDAKSQNRGMGFAGVCARLSTGASFPDIC